MDRDWYPDEDEEERESAICSQCELSFTYPESLEFVHEPVCAACGYEDEIIY